MQQRLNKSKIKKESADTQFTRSTFYILKQLKKISLFKNSHEKFQIFCTHLLHCISFILTLTFKVPFKHDLIMALNNIHKKT